jgi:hypothetical protein
MRNGHGTGVDELAVQPQDRGEGETSHDAAEMGAHARMIRDPRSRGHCLERSARAMTSPGDVVEIARRTYRQIP